jgi:predicted DNA-binding transcriptional regulator AlpA
MLSDQTVMTLRRWEKRKEPTLKQYVTLKQLAQIFGVSERHLYRQKAAGRLPKPVRIGRSNRWEPEECRDLFTGKNTKKKTK